ncbi:hypothetical protein [Pseudohaliea rubra]|uniref:Uncharacterized protein n=1 Tax=Pseudohaliea rubra DSM 19751 TaxID=1265313 RepID=A0A095XUC4_9GAMM|nr:hypothetical protein [Pseudohaliea rubra]KGE03291.1 hypothetical protein HRUBRA_02125 [Pseudohaliea rubra DSM 19751]
MSLFRIVKYSSLLFFLRRYRGRIFRVLAVLLFALVTNVLYQDVAHYLQLRHPGALVWALAGKILIVYGALAFVLWQFRPVREAEPPAATTATKAGARAAPAREQSPASPDRLSALADLEHHDRLRSRYDAVLEARGKAPRNPE